MQIYSIKNEKLEFFNRPVYVESLNEMLSYVQNILMSDADRALRGLKGDLAVYLLGDIDFTTGKISAAKKPVRCCDLESIFDSIPSESVPQSSKQLYEQITKLWEKVHALESEREVSCES